MFVKIFLLQSMETAILTPLKLGILNTDDKVMDTSDGNVLEMEMISLLMLTILLKWNQLSSLEES